MVEMGVKKRKITEKSIFRYNGIDIVKFVMSVLIVAIHAQPFTSVNMVLNQVIVDCIARVAVPFFFVASGFFVFKKAEEDSGYVKRYCLRMLRLYILWSIIYLPINIYECIFENGMSIKNAVLDIVWRTFISGSYMQLWYFPALIVAVLFVYFCAKCKMKDVTILIIGVFLYILGLSYQGLNGLFMRLPFMQEGGVVVIVNAFYEAIITTRNGIFFGVFFVAIGRCFANGKFDMSLKISITGVLVWLALGIVETQYLILNEIAWDRDMWMFLPCISIFLFALALHIGTNIHNAICYKLRNASVIIFLVHVAYEVMYRAVIINVFNIPYNSVMAFVFTVVASGVTVVVIEFLKKNKCFEWISKLFG